MFLVVSVCLPTGGVHVTITHGAICHLTIHRPQAPRYIETLTSVYSATLPSSPGQPCSLHSPRVKCLLVWFIFG